MKEREIGHDAYWSDDILLGEIPLPDGASLVRLRLHLSEERYHGRTTAELVPLLQPTGTRSYVHARPYVLEPEITLTVGLFPTPVTQAQWAKSSTRHRKGCATARSGRLKPGTTRAIGS